MDLKGKKAIVTGAGKGIGRAIAHALAREGVDVALIARTRPDLESVANEIGSAYDVRTQVVAVDVSDRQQVERAVAAIREELGSIDILINNAGIAHFGTVMEMEPEVWERIIRVNLLGTYYVTRAVLPGLLEQNSGDIINVASTAGERGAATISAYSASKAAMLAFTESLMPEVRKNNVRVTALVPSTVNTELAASVGLKIGEEGRMMQPEDVAELTLDLLRLPQRVFVRNVAILTTNPQ